MPALRNSVHESMCRDVAGGMSREAAWRAHGFGSRNSTRFFKRPKIAERVEELRQEFNEAAGIHLRYIQEKLLAIASSDITNYFQQNQWGTLSVRKNLAELPSEMRSAISELKIDRNGQVQLKLESKAHAIDTLLKTMGNSGDAGGGGAAQFNFIWGEVGDISHDIPMQINAEAAAKQAAKLTDADITAGLHRLMNPEKPLGNGSK